MLASTALPCGAEIWRIGRRDGGWHEFGKVSRARFPIPKDWQKRAWFPDFPSTPKDGEPLEIEREQENPLPSSLKLRLLSLSPSPARVVVRLNGKVACDHTYEPARVWLHDSFDLSLSVYLPLQWQRRGKNVLTISPSGNTGRFDYLELEKFNFDRQPQMWLFAGIGSPEYVKAIRKGRLALEWIDFQRPQRRLAPMRAQKWGETIPY